MHIYRALAFSYSLPVCCYDELRGMGRSFKDDDVARNSRIPGKLFILLSQPRQAMISCRSVNCLDMISSFSFNWNASIAFPHNLRT